MNEKTINFLPLNHVKLEEDSNDYHNNNNNNNNNNSEYCNGNKENINFLGKNEIKCEDKCFDIVDKWIARAVVQVPTGNNWHNIIARETALLKVRYPFLPEQQLRGKALMKFGIPSLCGNVIRTGAGKVTGAIARELSERKTKKKTRIPIAFKVVNKKIIPCINKFETKPETNMWIQENQRVTNLYNRGRTFTGEKVEQNRRMENYWRQAKVSSIVENPASRLALSSSVNNETNINNNFKNRNINESKKKIKYEPISPESQRLLQKITNDCRENICDENNSIAFDRKSVKTSLLSKFNNSDIKILNKNTNTNHLNERTEFKAFLRESSIYSQRLNNNSKKNNSDEVEYLTTKKKQHKMKTISPESLKFLERTRLASKIHKISDDDIDRIVHQSPIDCSLKTDPRSFFKNMEINLESVQLHSKELFSKFNTKSYHKQNFINNRDDEIPSQSEFGLNESQSCSPVSTLRYRIKRHSIDSTDISSSPSKMFKHNHEHQYDETLVENSVIRQYYTAQTISNESIHEFPRSQLSLPDISQPSSRAILNFHTDSFNEDLENSVVNEYNDESKALISHSYTNLSSIQCDSSVKSNPRQYSPVPAMWNIHKTLRNSWKEMTSEDFDCPENKIATQDSRTTCTLTPDINEILTEIDVPVVCALENISTQVSVDLLDRQHFFETAMDVDPEIFCASYNTQQRNIKYKQQKFFMLSDFCSEYDKKFKRLRNLILNNKQITMTYISMAEIKIGINKALEILEFSGSSD